MTVFFLEVSFIILKVRNERKDVSTNKEVYEVGKYTSDMRIIGNQPCLKKKMSRKIGQRVT